MFQNLQNLHIQVQFSVVEKQHAATHPPQQSCQCPAISTLTCCDLPDGRGAKDKMDDTIGKLLTMIRDIGKIIGNIYDILFYRRYSLLLFQ